MPYRNLKNLSRGLFSEPHHWPQKRWRLIVWSILGTLAITGLFIYGRTSFLVPPYKQTQANQPSLVIPLSPTPSTTPTATAAATAFTVPDPTATPTSVPRGQALVLRPEAPDLGWVVSDDETFDAGNIPPNYFGDSFLYAGILAGKVYNAAVQFDLSLIPRGTKIHGASLRLTGLRTDLLDKSGPGAWWLRFLAPEIDNNWRTLNYQQIHNSAAWFTFEPPLTPDQLGQGQVNTFEFTPKQIALLERHILEGSGKVSFRLDGPMLGDDNLFAWDSGYGPASQGLGPELFLNLGPPLQETPPPHYVVVTSTPTPENVMTAAAISRQLTAEATRIGTATSVPSNWITPVVVTPTMTPENQATAQIMSQLATAIVLTTGEPAHIVTATPTPAYVIITSTPTPENVMTATPTPIAIVTSSPAPQPLPAALLGKIVFLSDREGATEEERLQVDKQQAKPQAVPHPYVFDPATGQLERLTATGPYEVALVRDAWSANKTYEAYTQALLWTGEKQVLAIHYYDYEYNIEQQVTRMGIGIVYDPAWSPVSDEIAFVATESGNDEIWVIKRDGSEIRQLTRNQWEWDKHPSWSPDGEHIVFYSNRTGNNQLWIMNKDGSEARLLMAANPYNDWDPVWIKYLEPAREPR